MKPTAAFEWRMTSRSRDWIKAWDVKTATYDKGYVSPQSWSVIFTPNTSKGGGFEIAIYHWEITGLDGIQFLLKEDIKPVTFVVGIAGQAPGEAKVGLFNTNLPRLGRYRVTLTVTNGNGEKSDPLTQVIELQDLLIAAIGDSMASGEGVPDRDKTDDADPVWTDLRCHRSQRAGHALTAVSLETPHRSVTFLSFACSGAAIGGGVIGRYDGFVSPSGPHERLPSQVDSISQAIGTRTVDLLLVTAGINDVGPGVSFANFIHALAHPDAILGLHPDEAKARVTSNLRVMPEHYNLMAWYLSRRLHGRVKRTFITEYPAHIFQPNGDGKREGCGNLFLISDSDGDFIFEKGRELNGIIRGAAELHGWHFVTGIQEAFEGHGYCAGDQGWYVTHEQSEKRLGGESGTIHPKAIGHRAIRDRIVETIRTSPTVTHHAQQVTVTFESVEVLGVADGSSGPGKPPMTLKPVTLVANGQHNEIGPVTFNRQQSLLEKDFTFTFFVDDGLAGPLVELLGSTHLPRLGPVDQQVDPKEPITPLKPKSDEQVPVSFRLAFGSSQKFGEGSHTHQVGDLARGGMKVSFRIQVKNAIELQTSVPGGTPGKVAPIGN